jgi:hypothetical protein
MWPLSESSGFSGHASFVARNEKPCRQREAHILNARGWVNQNLAVGSSGRKNAHSPTLGPARYHVPPRGSP